MEGLGMGFSIVKTLQRHKSLPIELLAGLEGSDPAELQPYLDYLEEAGVVEIEKDRVSIRPEPTVPPK